MAILDRFGTNLFKSPPSLNVGGGGFSQLNPAPTPASPPRNTGNMVPTPGTSLGGLLGGGGGGLNTGPGAFPSLNQQPTVPTTGNLPPGQVGVTGAGGVPNRGMDRGPSTPSLNAFSGPMGILPLLMQILQPRQIPGFAGGGQTGGIGGFGALRQQLANQLGQNVNPIAAGPDARAQRMASVQEMMANAGMSPLDIIRLMLSGGGGLGGGQ